MAETEWRDHAACRGTDDEWWFPTAASLNRGKLPVNIHPAAKACCERCEVFDDCRAYALANESYGTWAGMTEEELRRTKRRAREARRRAVA